MSKTNHKSSHKSKSTCNGKCQSSIKCHGDCHEITAEKNLLNLSYLTEGSRISGPDISATYEIVIFNRSPYKLTHLSICDSFLGLFPNTFDSDGTFGGELRPYFTNVAAEPCDPNIIPNTFEQIVAKKGELIACGSYIPAHSIGAIMVRITGRGFLLPTPPNQQGGSGNQIPFSTDPKYSMCVQNTSIIRGNLVKKLPCHCHVSAPIFPLYVKSGIQTAVKGTLFNVLPTPEV